MIRYAEKNGIIITEVLEGQGVMSAPDEIYAPPQMPKIDASTNMELANSLLNELGYETTREAEVGIPDVSASGFELSIKADLLAKKGDSKIIILSKKIPQQFIDSLKTQGRRQSPLRTEKREKPSSRKSCGLPMSFFHSPVSPSRSLKRLISLQAP